MQSDQALYCYSNSQLDIPKFDNGQLKNLKVNKSIEEIEMVKSSDVYHIDLGLLVTIMIHKITVLVQEAISTMINVSCCEKLHHKLAKTIVVMLTKLEIKKGK